MMGTKTKPQWISPVRQGNNESDLTRDAQHSEPLCTWQVALPCHELVAALVGALECEHNLRIECLQVRYLTPQPSISVGDIKKIYLGIKESNSNKCSPVIQDLGCGSATYIQHWRAARALVP